MLLPLRWAAPIGPSRAPTLPGGSPGYPTPSAKPASAPLDNQPCTYDAKNCQSQVQDANAQRIARTTGQGSSQNTVVYFYGDEGLIGEATATGSRTTEYSGQPRNLWGTDPLYTKTTTTNGSAPPVFYYQNDHLGIPQAIVHQAGALVWPVKAETAVMSWRCQVNIIGEAPVLNDWLHWFQYNLPVDG